MKYTDLFSVEILHDYHADGRARHCALLPTPECKRLLRDSGLITKMHRNKLYVIARTDDGTMPFHPLPAASPFTFYLQVLSSDVHAMSNLPLNAADSARYLFSNRGGAQIDGKRYLYDAPPVFDAAAAWEAGQFVRDAQDECYECLVDLAPSSSSLANANHWRGVGKVAYATAEQLMRMCGSEITAEVTPAAAEVHAELFRYNPVSGQYDVSVYSASFTHEAVVEQQRLSLTGLPEDVYLLRVNGNDSMLHLRPAQDWYDAVGIVRIYPGDSVPATHRVLNGNGSFAHPLFSLRVAPLNVLWEYRARTDSVKNVHDTGTESITFTTAGSRTFRSTLPHRLRETAYDTITIEFNDTNPVDPSKTIQIGHADVPGFRRRGTAIQNGTEYITSQVILNY